jgi:hypothetical protein
MYKYSKIIEVLKSKRVELRHDVDISLISAYKMAKYEKDMGVKSIYYIRFDSDYYNVLSHENYKIIDFIMKNHEIGCHVDVTNINDEIDLLNYLNRYKKIIDFNKFTFHINNEKTKLFTEINGFLNKSILKNEYISDSKNIFNKNTLNKITELDDYTLVIHPEWWDNKDFIFNKNSKNALISSMRHNRLKKTAIKEILKK